MFHYDWSSWQVQNPNEIQMSFECMMRNSEWQTNIMLVTLNFSLHGSSKPEQWKSAGKKHVQISFVPLSKFSLLWNSLRCFLYLIIIQLIHWTTNLFHELWQTLKSSLNTEEHCLCPRFWASLDTLAYEVWILRNCLFLVDLCVWILPNWKNPRIFITM